MDCIEKFFIDYYNYFCIFNLLITFLGIWSFYLENYIYRILLSILTFISVFFQGCQLHFKNPNNYLEKVKRVKKYRKEKPIINKKYIFEII